MSPRLRELYVSYRNHSSGAHIDAHQITSAAAAAAVLVPVLENQSVELFVVLHLDAKRRVLALQEIARGGIDKVEVPIRSILTGCLGSYQTHALVLAHSHPSGDTSPSPDDLALTGKIIAACALFEIEVLDHLIVGGGTDRFSEYGTYGTGTARYGTGTYCSLKESGRLERVRVLTGEVL